MTVFDKMVPIHETDGELPSMHSLIETLDAMLNHHNVRHVFAFPTYEEQERVREEKGKELLYCLYYEEEQGTELTLIVALFIKQYLKKDDSDILAAIVKSMSKAA